MTKTPPPPNDSISKNGKSPVTLSENERTKALLLEMCKRWRKEAENLEARSKEFGGLKKEFDSAAATLKLNAAEIEAVAKGQLTE